MATKRKAVVESDSVGTKRANVKSSTSSSSSASSKGPIDLTSDSDEEPKLRTAKTNTAASSTAKQQPVNGIAHRADDTAANNMNASIIGQSVAETKKPVAAAAILVPILPAASPIVVPQPAAASTAAAASSSSTVRSAVVAPSPSPPLPTTYKSSEAYVAAQANNPKGVKRLATEYARLSSVKEYSVTLVDNDLYLWEIKIPFDSTTTLGQDLANYYTTDRHVVIRMSFDSTHPFKAPFVRVRSPRFLKGSSNVMEGGAICMDTFSTIGWSPAMTAEKSILAIQSLLCTPGLNVRLDPVAHNREYTEEEGKRSYSYVLQAHKEWEQTGSYSQQQPLMPAAAALPPRPHVVAAAAKRK